MIKTIITREKAVISLAIVFAFVILLWLISLKNDTNLQNIHSVQEYSTIEKLSAASDAVVIGTVKGIAGTDVDYKGEKYGWIFGKGMPVVYYEVDVTKMLRNETDKSIFILGLDTEQVITEEATTLRDGEKVILFLREHTYRDTPSLDLFDYYYETLSFDIGVFDILPGDIVQPRKPDSLNEEVTTTFNLSALCERIQGPTSQAGYKKFSKYGISISYPETYWIGGSYDNNIIGNIDIRSNDTYLQEYFTVVWTNKDFIDAHQYVSDKPIEECILDDALQNQEYYYNDLQKLIETTKSGHRVLIQPYTEIWSEDSQITIKSATNNIRYKIVATLDCTASNRVYTIYFGSNKSDDTDILYERFMKYFDSFTCHA